MRVGLIAVIGDKTVAAILRIVMGSSLENILNIVSPLLKNYMLFEWRYINSK